MDEIIEHALKIMSLHILFCPIIPLYRILLNIRPRALLSKVRPKVIYKFLKNFNFFN